MPADQPLVSVVTPSYNQGQFIEETLTSVAEQSYDHIEHIVVDGGSADGTLDILKRYEGQYDLTWVSEDDDGQAQAINKGFSMADGEVVAWLNSDDLYLHRGTIRNVVAERERVGDAILYGHSVKISPDNQFLRVKTVPTFDRPRLLRRCFVVQPSVYLPRHVVETERLNEDLAYSMDYEYWLRLSERFDWHRIDRVLSADRNHPNRKIIQDETASQSESDALRKQYDSVNGLRDDAINGAEIVLSRVLGLRYLRELRTTPQTVDVDVDPLYQAVLSQLFIDDRSMHPPSI